MKNNKKTIITEDQAHGGFMGQEKADALTKALLTKGAYISPDVQSSERERARLEARREVAGLITDCRRAGLPRPIDSIQVVDCRRFGFGAK